MTRLFAWLWYPGFFAFGIALFMFMLGRNYSPLLAMYVPIAIVAVAIVAMEAVYPARQDWKPRRSDVVSDALFIVFIQTLVPRALAAGLALALAAWVHARLNAGATVSATTIEASTAST